MDYKDHNIDKFNANEHHLKKLKVMKKENDNPNEVVILQELIDDGLKKRKVLIDKMNVFKTEWWE